MTAEQKVKQKYPDAYVGCSWSDGKLVAFIYNPSPEAGDATISDDFTEPQAAWESALARMEATHE